MSQTFDLAQLGEPIHLIYQQYVSRYKVWFSHCQDQLQASVYNWNATFRAIKILHWKPYSKLKRTASTTPQLCLLHAIPKLNTNVQNLIRVLTSDDDLTCCQSGGEWRHQWRWLSQEVSQSRPAEGLHPHTDQGSATQWSAVEQSTSIIINGTYFVKHQ